MYVCMKRNDNNNPSIKESCLKLQYRKITNKNYIPSFSMLITLIYMYQAKNLLFY